MFKKLLLLSTVFMLALASSSALADTIFTLDQNFSCCGTSAAGTVTLHQNGTNDVLVTVQLTNDYSFRSAPDANHHGFVFDLSGVTGTVGVSNLTDGPASQTFSFLGAGSYNDPPFGSFGYAIDCTTCSKGTPTTPTQMLSFDVTGGGLMESSFVSNGSAVFAVDVIGLSSKGGTGNVGTLDPGVPPTVPEPSSLLLFGTGALGLAGMLRRRLTK